MRGDLMWTCLVWAEQSTPDNIWVPSDRFNSATGEQKGITQTIYTDPEPPSRLPNPLMPSAKLRSVNLPFFTSLVWRGRGLNPGPSQCRYSGVRTMPIGLSSMQSRVIEQFIIFLYYFFLLYRRICAACDDPCEWGHFSTIKELNCSFMINILLH